MADADTPKLKESVILMDLEAVKPKNAMIFPTPVIFQ